MKKKKKSHKKTTKQQKKTPTEKQVSTRAITQSLLKVVYHS